MSKYTITALRKKELPKKAGGTWTKVEIKTAQTGEQILDLGMGIPNRDKIAVGSVIDGYIEKKQWGERDGVPQFNTSLNGITTEYVYAMLLSIHPELVNFQMPSAVAAPVVEEGNWNTGVANPPAASTDIQMDATEDPNAGF